MNTVRTLPHLAAFAALLTAGQVQAAVTITSTVSQSGGLYTYSYSVTNSLDATDALAYINLNIGQGVAVTNATAPAGFQITADGDPINLVTFLEGDPFIDPTPGTFDPGSTVEFFTYQSTSGPGLLSYEAVDASFVSYTGTVQSAVPEPSGMMLAALSALPLIVIRRRKSQ